MKKQIKIVTTAWLIGLMAAFGGWQVAIAQDVTPTAESTEVVVVNPPAATDVANAPAPVDNNPPATNTDTAPSERTLTVIGLIIFAVVMIAKDVLQGRKDANWQKTIISLLENNQVVSEARERYMQSSLSTQEVIKFLESTLRLLSAANLPVVDPLLDKAAEFGDKVISTAPSAN